MTTDNEFEKWYNRMFLNSEVSTKRQSDCEDAWQAAKQQPLKRLSDVQVEIIATDDKFWEANGFSAHKLKWDDFANAIMDEMQEINK